MRRGDLAGAGALVPDDLLDRFAFAGTPEQVARQTEAILAAGASRVEFGTPHGLTAREGLRLLAEEAVHSAAQVGEGVEVVDLLEQLAGDDGWKGAAFGIVGRRERRNARIEALEHLLEHRAAPKRALHAHRHDQPMPH